MKRIARFEALAEQLVEGTFTRLFAGYVHPLEVATHLARAMEDQQVIAPDGTALAPTHYWVYLHPQDFGALITSQPTLPEELARHVTRLARGAGLLLAAEPVVYVEPLLDVPAQSVRVKARWQPATEVGMSATSQMTEEEQEAVQSAAEEVPLRRSFLILNGQKHVDLAEAVVSIGRALDNDVILEDPRVSRHHAQLRRRYGRYVLYDVGSSGGTSVNGYPVQECMLQPGDVISFAGSEVIYGEDLPAASPRSTGGGDTSTLSSATAAPPMDEG